MLPRHCFLLSMFLVFFINCQAQQVPSEAAQLKAGIIKARELLQEIRQKRDSLEQLRDALQDTLTLQAALDSLQRTYTDPKALQRQSDSLLHSFASRTVLLRQLTEAEQQLQAEISKATEALARELLPKEALQALAELEKTEAASKAFLLPKELLAGQLKLEKLPAPEELQGLAKARTLKAAGDHLAGHEAELNKARRELDKYKGRFESMKSVRAQAKGFRLLNPLKGKPLPERIYMGTLWQFGNQERFLIDLGPYAAWRFTDKISTGAGLQYRLRVSVEEKPWVSGKDKVRGFFAFADVEVWKGIYGRVHYERLNAPVPTIDAAGKVEQVGQEWVPGLSVGIGKNYTFYKTIQGFALMQYNLLHAHNRSPYLQPLQAKIGFFILGSSLRKMKMK